MPERIENSVSGVMLRSIFPFELVYTIGRNLKIGHENEEEGVFFINAKRKDMRATSFGRGNDIQMAVVVPSLAAVAYTVQVRAHRDEEGLQFGRLTTELTVELAGSRGRGESKPLCYVPERDRAASAEFHLIDPNLNAVLDEGYTPYIRYAYDQEACATRQQCRVDHRQTDPGSLEPQYGDAAGDHHRWAQYRDLAGNVSHRRRVPRIAGHDQFPVLHNP